MKSKFSIKKIALIGLMVALVYVASGIQIDFPAQTRIHLGNIMCLLSAFILGPIGGGLAAGIGSFFFDVTTKYVDSAPYTLVFKFLMAFVCGKIAWSKNRKAEKFTFNILGGIIGIVLYIFLFLSKNVILDLYVHKLEIPVIIGETLTRLWTSLINGSLAVVCSVILSQNLKKTLKKARIEL